MLRKLLGVGVMLGFCTIGTIVSVNIGNPLPVIAGMAVGLLGCLLIWKN